jgi:hypothetical protein
MLHVFTVKCELEFFLRNLKRPENQERPKSHQATADSAGYPRLSMLAAAAAAAGMHRGRAKVPLCQPYPASTQRARKKLAVKVATRANLGGKVSSAIVRT